MTRLAIVGGMLAWVAVAAPLTAQQGPRVAHQPSPDRPYSAAVQVGNTYWLAGKVGVTSETRAMTTGRTAAETHNVMRAFRTLFDELGLGFGDVVQATVYLSDIDDYAEMNEAYAQYFDGDAPARVAIAVAGIPGDAAVEIAFVAVKTP